MESSVGVELQEAVRDLIAAARPEPAGMADPALQATTHHVRVLAYDHHGHAQHLTLLMTAAPARPVSAEAVRELVHALGWQYVSACAIGYTASPLP
jgi:hypothetical protein